jgi:hypothetical protein
MGSFAIAPEMLTLIPCLGWRAVLKIAWRLMLVWRELALGVDSDVLSFGVWG